MKFLAAVVLTLALALGAQCSIIPYPYAPLGYRTEIAGSGLTYTATSGPAVLPSPHAIAYSPYVSPYAAYTPYYPFAPAIAPAHAPVVVAAAGPASYVAQTRGAVHTAPLEGHTTSVAATNLAPAPGTL